MRTKLLTMLTVLLSLFSTSLKAQETAYYWYVGQEDPANNSTITSTTGEQGWRLIQQPNSVTKDNPLFDTTDSSDEAIVGTASANWYIAFPADKSYRIFDSDHADQITMGNFYEYSRITFKDIEYIVYKGYGSARKWWGYTIYSSEVVEPEPETAYYWYVGWTLPTSLEELKILAVESESSHGGSITEISSEKLLTNSSEIRNSSNAHYYVVIPVGYDIYDATLPNTPITNNSFTEVTDIVIANHEIYKSNDGARSNSGLEIYEATKYYWYVGTSIPAELNGAVSNPETDKWVEIGTEIPSYIKVTTASDYSFPTWYVVMPTSFQFRPHDGGGIDDESSVWEISFSSIDGYTLYTVKDETSEIQSVFKKRGSLPYKADADYWYLGQSDPSVMTEISPISVYNWASVSDSWEEILDPSKEIELNKQPNDWDYDSFTALWYVAIPASSGYTPQDADLWETSTATIAGKEYIVYKSEGKVWELNTAFLPEGYVEENPEPEPYVTEFEQGGIHYIFLEKYVANDELGAWVTSTNGWFVGEENTYSGDIVVPSTVTYGGKEYPVMGICDEAFERCTVNSITLSEGVIYVSPKAFKETMLGALYLPSTFRMWDNFFTDEVNGYMLLQGCIGLETLVVSSEHPIYDSRDNCNAIIETATNTLIEGCKGTVIPASVTTLGPTAFMGRDIVELIIPEGVKEVKGRVFDGCKNLQRVVFPSSVEVIKGNMLFYGCSSLTSVEIPQTALIRSAENHEESFETPGSMVIPSYMFSECTALQEFAIPNNVTSIGSGAFFMCKNLEAITIPESVTAIGDLAFNDCDNMTEVTLLGQTPPAVLVDAFNEAQYKQITLNVPEGAEEAYKQHEVWGKFFKEEEPEPTPEPASVAFTFTRDADVAVNVEGIEGVTASIEAAPAAYLTTAAAANDSILCINQNTSTATADNPNKYTLTITNNSGVDLAFDYINVCGVALTSDGNFQGVRTVRDRVFVVSYGDNTLAPATMRICDDSHCSGVATVNTFEAADAIPASSTYVIGVSIYTDGGAGCFYGLTRITLGKNEPEGGDVTNIESPVLEAQGSQLIYDLMGRRVEKAEKGIYIVNGKKVVIK